MSQCWQKQKQQKEDTDSLDLIWQTKGKYQGEDQRIFSNKLSKHQSGKRTASSRKVIFEKRLKRDRFFRSRSSTSLFHKSYSVSPIDDLALWVRIPNQIRKRILRHANNYVTDFIPYCFNPLLDNCLINNLQSDFRTRRPHSPSEYFQTTYCGTGFKIWHSTVSFLRKDILIVPFSSLMLEDPLINFLKRLLPYDIEGILRVKNSQRPFQDGQLICFKATGIKHYQALYLFKIPASACKWYPALKLLRKAFRNIFCQATIFKDRSIVIPDFKIKGISKDNIQNIIVWEIMQNIKQMHKQDGTCSIKQVIICYPNLQRCRQLQKKIKSEIERIK